MARHISQREARRLAARVRQLEQQRAAMTAYWRQDYIGVHVASEPNATQTAQNCIKTALKLGFVVLARIYNEGEIAFHAVRPDAEGGQ